MDHIRRETLDFSNLKIVVLDEADEMLRMGFSEDVEFILGNTPKDRQTALFSATMPRQVRRIADKYITNAINVEIERKTMEVPLITQYYVNVSEGQKADTLTRILEVESNSNEATLVFHRTKIGAADLASKLQARGYSAEAMHGDMSQAQREQTIKRLKNGQVEIVVALMLRLADWTLTASRQSLITMFRATTNRMFTASVVQVVQDAKVVRFCS